MSFVDKTWAPRRISASSNCLLIGHSLFPCYPNAENGNTFLGMDERGQKREEGNVEARGGYAA